MDSQQQQRGDASLDFFSPQFDAAKALATPGLQPPDAEAQPLDYVAKCRFLLPAELPESLAENKAQQQQQPANEVCGADVHLGASPRQTATLHAHGQRAN